MNNAEEYIKKVHFTNPSGVVDSDYEEVKYQEPFTYGEMVEYMESYHKARVEAVTEEMINKRFAVFHSKGKTSDNRKKRSGAKWFKEQLLKE